MKITSIQPQVRRVGRYNVFVDGKYAFALSADGVLEAKLVPGQELAPSDIIRYKKMADEDKAYMLTLAYVARRMRSEGELRDYFRRKGYSEAFGEAMLPKLRALRLLDDEDFARHWVANRRLLKGTSTKKLRLELRQKHIADATIARVLAEDETDERTVLRELVAKKRRQSRYQDDQKLIAYLARQGFNYDDIKASLTPEE